jgi:hypothetical protein
MILVLRPVFLFKVNMYWASTTPATRAHTLALATAPTLATAARSMDRALVLLGPKNERPLARLQASCRDTGAARATEKPRRPALPRATGPAPEKGPPPSAERQEEGGHRRAWPVSAP